jgi:hypothetical protein
MDISFFLFSMQGRKKLVIVGGGLDEHVSAQEGGGSTEKFSEGRLALSISKISP